MSLAESFHGIGTYILLLMVMAPSEFANQYPIPSLISLICLAIFCFQLLPKQKTIKHYVLMAGTIWLGGTVASIIVAIVFRIQLGNWH